MDGVLHEFVVGFGERDDEWVEGEEDGGEGHEDIFVFEFAVPCGPESEHAGEGTPNQSQ